ncbi:hypothetical protein COLO4_22323 [Corchorus olitorius]|uniref:Uncharacterized protein n=1 Tax=Corchorus olitorius TaxID=93759 RepID=A0A1R3IMY6_9ROSI|nr:hypothetical protein COLO4_22323 [Corchorus olitorius]
MKHVDVYSGMRSVEWRGFFLVEESGWLRADGVMT